MSTDPNSREVTLNDVAREAGVSSTTVSHVINGTRFVAPETVERVHRAIERLRYEVNYNARNLKTGRSQVIGVLISDVTNPHFSGVVRGVEDVATRAGYQMILCNTDEDPAKELTYLRMLRSKGVDGALMVPTGARHDYLDHLFQAAFPLVFVDRVLPDVPCDAVLADNVGGAHQAVSHLIRLGHRRIGIIGGPSEWLANDARMAGYVAPLAEAGVLPTPELVRLVPEPNTEHGYRAACDLLDLRRRPTALVAFNDKMAVGALRAAAERGLRVPEDVSVAGFDDIDISRATRPLLTTVRQPLSEMGRMAVTMLMRRLDRHTLDALHVSLGTELIVRDSTGPVRRR
jgi:LacI family transcriptional regulator